MSLSREEVKHIAKLARLELSDKEIEKYSDQLSSVLGYMEILNEIDTSKVKETDQVTGLMNVTREDKIESSVNPEDLLKCSSLPIFDNQIKVKKVL